MRNNAHHINAMKIERHTDAQLIISDVPWAIGIAICGWIVGLIGWAMFAFSAGDTAKGLMLTLVAIGVGVIACFAVRRIDIILDRGRNLFEIRRSTVFRRTRIQHALNHLARAEVETYADPRHPRRRYHRIALILDGGMDEGAHPLTDGYAHGHRAERTANSVATTINDWLAQDVDSEARRA
ncbi:hypothetical protein [Loktanella sp. S4079]|uniref:hypothetical protein n=1 Tax=Loktanella sp. S4079 TaxID=579483 RepID=UPI000698196E|nr:hypothetical protein [Loktanella sp. S4079]